MEPHAEAVDIVAANTVMFLYWTRKKKFCCVKATEDATLFVRVSRVV